MKHHGVANVMKSVSADFGSWVLLDGGPFRSLCGRIIVGVVRPAGEMLIIFAVSTIFMRRCSRCVDDVRLAATARPLMGHTMFGRSSRRRRLRWIIWRGRFVSLHYDIDDTSLRVRP